MLLGLAFGPLEIAKQKWKLRPYISEGNWHLIASSDEIVDSSDDFCACVDELDNGCDKPNNCNCLRHGGDSISLQLHVILLRPKVAAGICKAFVAGK